MQFKFRFHVEEIHLMWNGLPTNTMKKNTLFQRWKSAETALKQSNKNVSARFSTRAEKVLKPCWNSAETVLNFRWKIVWNLAEKVLK